MRTRPPGRTARDRGVQGGVGARALERDVDRDRGGRVRAVSGDLERLRGTRRQRGTHAMCEAVRGHDLLDTRRPQCADEHEADRAGAVHARPEAGARCVYRRRGRRVVDPDPGEVEGVDRDAKDLEKGRLVVRDRCRQRDAPVRRPGEPRPEAAVVGRQAREAHPGAQPAAARTALLTGPTRVRGVDRDPLAVAGAALDHAGELVPEHERGREVGLPDRALVVPVEVGSAQPDGRDPDDHLAVARNGRRLGMQAHVAPPVQTDGATGRRSWAHGSDRPGRSRAGSAFLVLAPDVEVHGDEQDERLDRELVVDRDGHDAHADVQHPEEQGADDGAGDRADAAVGGRAADERRRDDVELEAVARLRRRGVEAAPR